jgi:hypothetical protein
MTKNNLKKKDSPNKTENIMMKLNQINLKEIINMIYVMINSNFIVKVGQKKIFMVMQIPI